jgi:hypothetical protein
MNATALVHFVDFINGVRVSGRAELYAVKSLCQTDTAMIRFREVGIVGGWRILKRQDAVSDVMHVIIGGRDGCNRDVLER